MLWEIVCWTGEKVRAAFIIDAFDREDEPCRAIGPSDEANAYADRIELRQDGHVVGEHPSPLCLNHWRINGDRSAAARPYTTLGTTCRSWCASPGL